VIPLHLTFSGLVRFDFASRLFAASLPCDFVPCFSSVHQYLALECSIPSLLTNNLNNKFPLPIKSVVFTFLKCIRISLNFN